MGILLYLASLKFSQGGWVVGKSDFNENPVVSPDLDLDFGLRLWFVNIMNLVRDLIQTKKPSIYGDIRPTRGGSLTKTLLASMYL